MYELMEQERMALIVCHAYLGAKGPSKRGWEHLTQPSPQPHLNGVPSAHRRKVGRGNVLCMWNHEAYGLRFHENVALESFSHQESVD